MNICIITPRYPTTLDPTAMPFVQQLAWALTDLGNTCTVVCPQNFSKKLEREYIENTPRGGTVKVYLPSTLHLGQQTVLGFNTSVLTTHFFWKAAKKIVAKLPKQDVVYGHFITPSGITAARLHREFGIPAFLGYGESSSWSIEHYGADKVKKELYENLAGVVAVSSKNAEVLRQFDVVGEEKVKVFPNGFDDTLFYPRDKKEAREKLGLPQDEFIVSFVGHFIERKGIHKLIPAAEKAGVKMICAGKGPIDPTGENCLFANTVGHEQLPWFYSASDAFVLPTVNEGCCNAIVEALACGLPIVSSDLPFNYDILDKTNALLVDPSDVDALAEAIRSLRENEDLRQSLSRGSLEKAKTLTLRQRAKNILRFFQGEWDGK